MADTADTIRSYADHAELSHNAVWKMRNEGKLVLDARGRILRTASDARRLETTDPSRAGGRGRQAQNGTTSANADFYTARAAQAAIDARIKELGLRKRLGELVEADAVRRLWLEEAQRAIAMLDALPARVVPLLDVKDTTEAFRVIEEEIDRVKAMISGAGDRGRAKK